MRSIKHTFAAAKAHSPNVRLFMKNHVADQRTSNVVSPGAGDHHLGHRYVLVKFSRTQR
jgi:hypothetical protein